MVERMIIRMKNGIFSGQQQAQGHINTVPYAIPYERNTIRDYQEHCQNEGNVSAILFQVHLVT